MSDLAKLLDGADSRFASALKDRKIDPARLLVASHAIEALRPEDRAVKLAKSKAAGSEDASAKEARSKKPRSGRPVTPRLIADAISGKRVSGPAKTRLLRAFNAVAAQKKLDAVELKQLF